jgi:hypothetical protein
MGRIYTGYVKGLVEDGHQTRIVRLDWKPFNIPEPALGEPAQGRLQATAEIAFLFAYMKSCGEITGNPSIVASGAKYQDYRGEGQVVFAHRAPGPFLAGGIGRGVGHLPAFAHNFL